MRYWRETDESCTPQGGGWRSPAEAGRVRTSGVQGLGTTASDAALPAAAAGVRAAAGGADAGVGAGASALRLSADLGVVATGGLASEPQADPSAVASGRAESAAKTAEKAALGPQCQRLCPTAGGAQGPRVGVGLHPRPHARRPAAEVADDGGRVHARVPGVGGGPAACGRRT